MNLGHVATTRDQLLLQTQQLAHRRSEKPPKLPPRDNQYPHDIPKVMKFVVVVVVNFIVIVEYLEHNQIPK